jgi:hypothetical protein
MHNRRDACATLTISARSGAVTDALSNRAEKFDQLVMKANFRQIKIGEARSRLIARLAEHFREKGLKPTAAINYGKGLIRRPSSRW